MTINMITLKNFTKPFALLCISTLAAIVCLAAFPAFVAYVNWNAREKAQTFCADTPIGSDVQNSISKAEKMGIAHHHWFADGRGYTFIFHGFVMDKASCDLLLNKKRIVESKMTDFQED